MNAPTLPWGFTHDGTTRNGALRVRTPFTYPDGSHIDVFVTEDTDKVWLVTDYGTTETYLDNACKITLDRRGVAESCDVDYDGGELFRRVGPVESVSVSIILVACAARSVF